MRQKELSKGKIHITAFGNQMGIMQRFFFTGKQRQHFFIAFTIITVVIKFHPVGIVDRFIGLNAQQHVLRRGILFADVVDIIRHHQTHAILLCQTAQFQIHGLLFRQVMILHFQEEIIFAKNLNIFL